MIASDFRRFCKEKEIASERRARLIDQLELQLEELEASATEDELIAEEAAAKASTVRAFTRRHPVHNNGLPKC